MKKTLSILTAAASIIAAMTTASCTKEMKPDTEKTIDLSFTLEMAEDTKTLYHDNTIWWDAEDSVGIIQHFYKTADATARSYAKKSIKITQPSSTFTASYTFAAPAKYPAEYYAVYPSKALKAYVTGDIYRWVNIYLTPNQYPSADSFDGDADLMISENIHATSAQVTSFNLRFARIVALGKMNLKGIPGESPVTKVTFSAVHDGTAVRLGGQAYYDTETAERTGWYKSESSIALNYTDAAVSENFMAHFCTYPFSLDGGDSFKVTVNTADGRTYIKDAVIPEDGGLIFERNRATRFTANMSDTWLSASVSSSASNKITIWYYGGGYSKICKAIFKAESLAGLSEDQYQTAYSNAKSYGSTLYALTADNLTSIETNGKLGLNSTSIASGVSVEADTEYVVMIGAYNAANEFVFRYYKVKTPAA